MEGPHTKYPAGRLVPKAPTQAEIEGKVAAHFGMCRPTDNHRYDMLPMTDKLKWHAKIQQPKLGRRPNISGFETFA